MTGTPTSARTIRLADDVYGYVQDDGSWWLNNAAFVRGGDDTFLFDTCATEERTDLLLAAIAAAGLTAPTLVACSHPHSDHTHGLSRVMGARAIFAHPHTRAEVLGRGIVRNPAGFTPFDPGDVEARGPNVLIEGHVTLHVGDTRIELISLDTPAHSNADLIAWLPETGILLAGDLAFNGVTPLLMSGSVAGTIHALEEVLLPLDPDIVVPGHGGIAGARILHKTLEYCLLVERIATEAHKSGRSLLRAAEGANLGEFSTWLDSERLVANIHRAVAELEGTAPGVRIDFAQAMADMSALADTAPLRTRAGEPCALSPVEELDRGQLG